MILIKCKRFFFFFHACVFEKYVKYFLFQIHLVICIILTLSRESYKIIRFAIYLPNLSALFFRVRTTNKAYFFDLPKVSAAV